MKPVTHSAIIASIICTLSSTVFADTLTINVDTASDAGTVRAAIFGSQTAFAAGKMAANATAKAVEGNTVIVMKSLTAGSYGLTLFHDQNANEELDTNLLGAPIEPFGFSTNPKIGFSAPKFDAFTFDYDGTPQTLNITLNGG